VVWESEEKTQTKHSTMFNFHTLALALAVTGAFASPTPERRDGVTTLSADLINPWREAAHWAS
jgi:hypothetical protein